LTAVPTARAAAFIARLAVWLSTRHDVACAMLVGSQARAAQPADEWSDVDIVLVADEPAALLDDSGWLDELGVPLATFVEPTLLGQRERRVLFGDGLDVDFTVLSIAAAAPPSGQGTSSTTKCRPKQAICAGRVAGSRFSRRSQVRRVG
jgi:predicted nucleotidyltransferase